MGEKHNFHSSTREEYVEYILLAKLCSISWEQDRFVEVARAQTDAQGYDLVLACQGIMRHVQLKASIAGGRTSTQKINLGLGRKPGGCVIWVVVDPETLEPVEYLWFGGLPGQDLPDLGEKRAKHTKANADGLKTERDALRILNKGRFTRLKSATDVFAALFGKT